MSSKNVVKLIDEIKERIEESIEIISEQSTESGEVLKELFHDAFHCIQNTKKPNIEDDQTASNSLFDNNLFDQTY